MDDALRYATAVELRRWYSTGELSPVEHTRATLALLAEREPTLHAFVTVSGELALAQAELAERRLREADAGDRWPLLGVPLSVKDLTPTAGVRTTRGSARHDRWIPDHDAPAVARLRAAGAVIIGKTTTSEFGWSAATVNPLGPPAANPWDSRRSAGGSSGGAAAAVAAGIGVAALGTDGAGSIRVPAAFCGVVGFKPTFGRVPYVPVSPEGLSHIGPLARDVATVELVTRVIAGPDPADPFSAAPPTARPLPDSPRIAWLRWDDAGGEVDRVARDAVAAVFGAVPEVPVPFEDPYRHLVTILASFDATQPETDDARSDPARLAVVRHGRGLRATDLAEALGARAALVQAVDALMRDFDVLVMPTVDVEPFAVDAWRPDDGDDLDWLAWCRRAYPFNLTGMPAVSVPAGFTAAGLPVGLQLVGRRHEDALVLRSAGLCEQRRPWRAGYSGKDHS
ncbi:amidase [Saccharothrix isguenensis]